MSLLKEVFSAAHRYHENLPDKWILFDTLTRILNDNWSGTSIEFQVSDVAKAMHELQAIDSVVGRVDDDAAFLTTSLQIPKGRDYRQMFDVRTGLYADPTDYRALRTVLGMLPSGYRTGSVDTLASDLQVDYLRARRMLVELRYLGYYDFTFTSERGFTVTRKRIPEGGISPHRYELTFGRTAH